MASAMKPQPLDPGKGIAMMLFGWPGSGKTRFACSGSSVLLIRPPTDSIDSVPAGADVEEFVWDSWEEMFEGFAWGQQGGFDQYDWVWLDSLSLMQDRLLDDVMADALARRPDRAVAKGKTPDGADIMVPEFGFDQPEYKLNFDRIIKWISDMVALAKEGRFHFGVTCHPFEHLDPTTNKDILAPWVQGKNMPNKVNGFMNIVAYLQKIERDGDDPQTVLLTSAEGFAGKDQFYAAPELKSGRRGIIDPTVPKLEKLVKEARRGGGSATRARPKPRKKTKARKPRR